MSDSSDDHDGIDDSAKVEPELQSIEADIRMLSRDYSKEGELASGLIDAKRLISEFRNLESGDKLSHFQLVTLLRRGGHGQVWSAIDIHTGNEVAIKILNSIWSSTNTVRDRFQREAELLCQCDNSNLVKIQEAGVDGNIPFFVMELLDGQDLSRIINHIGPLQFDIAATIGFEIANGLDGLSKAGIIHRDIKPSNVILTQMGQVKIIDLGIGSQSGHGWTDITQTEEFLGSVDFMAPEQAFDPKQADTGSDLYSLGCTLYFLFTGKAPFDFIGDSTVLKRALAHASQPFPSIAQQRPDVPARLLKIIDLLVSKLPKDRPKSPTEVMNLLKPFVNHERLRQFAKSREKEDADQRFTANIQPTRNHPRKRSIASLILWASILSLTSFGGLWVSGLLNRPGEQIEERFPERAIATPNEGFYLGTNHNETAGRKDGMGMVFSGDLAVYLPPYSNPESPMPFGIIWVRNRQHELAKRGFIVFERPVDDRDIVVIDRCDGTEFSARYIYAPEDRQVAAFDKPESASPAGTLHGLWQSPHVILKEPNENASVALRKVWRELLETHAPMSLPTTDAESNAN